MGTLAQLARALLRFAFVAALVLAVKAVARLFADDGPAALVDALTLQKLGELLVLGPWLLGAASVPRGGELRNDLRAERVRARARVCLAAGAVLNAVAWSNLAARANWAWWCWVLVGAAVLGLACVHGPAPWSRAVHRLGAPVVLAGYLVAAGTGVLPDGSGYVWYPILGSPPAAPSEQLPRAERRAATWRAGLAFVERELERLHPNVFHTVDEASYRDGFRELAARVDELGDEALAVELEALVARIGDSHTLLSPGYRYFAPFQRLPLGLDWFADGLYVTWTPPELSDLQGARIERIDALSAEAALAQVGRVIAHENRSWLLKKSPDALVNTTLLHRLGCLPEPDRAELTLVPRRTDRADGGADGAREVQVLGSVDFNTPISWTSARERVTPREARGEPFWFERWPDRHPARETVYVRYAACRDPLGLRRLAGELAAELAEAHATDGVRVIVDLRGNSGGSSLGFSFFLLPVLSDGPWNAPDRLFCLIDRGTYSSGKWAALELATETEATLVGEPTGNRVNTYGDVRHFEVPGVGLEVYHSTKHHLNFPDEDHDAVYPDVELAPTYADWEAGRDPVLEFAVNAPAQRRP